MRYLILTIILLSLQQFGKTQSVYKTPSGLKYHLETCRMVENVSKKLVGEQDIDKYNLQPCKICNPPPKHKLFESPPSINKGVGEDSSVRCKGLTKQGTRCKHDTKMANGYCYQHNPDKSN